MATLRELKTRIGSVSSSEKITGAMKMISSAKVHKFEQMLRQLLPYKEQIQSIMGHILESDQIFHSPLIEVREVQRICLVVYGSDDGLCGAYNMNVFKFMLATMADMRARYGQTVHFTICPVGKKITHAVEKLDDPMISIMTIDGVDSKMDGDKVNGFTHDLERRFLNKEFDLVSTVYTNFISMARQRLKTEQMFPVDSAVLLENAPKEDKKEENKLYIFEPSAERIFNQVLPMFVLSAMQEITLENRASEQAARVMAMQSANDNAQKLLEELQLEYNKLRQQSITTELLDILGGQVQK